MILARVRPGWPLEPQASARRAGRAKAIVLAHVVLGISVAAVVGLSAGGLWLAVGVVAARFVMEHLGAMAARAIDVRYPLYPATDPLPAPPQPLNPSLGRAIAAVLVGIVGWAVVSLVLAICLLNAPPDLAIGAWGAFISVAAWSLVRVFLVHKRGDVDG